MEIQMFQKEVMDIKSTKRKLTSTSQKNFEYSMKSTIYGEQENIRLDDQGNLLMDIRIPEYAQKSITQSINGTYHDYHLDKDQEEMILISEQIKYGKAIDDMNVEELLQHNLIDIETIL